MAETGTRAVVKLEADVKDFMAGMSKAGDKTEQAMRQMQHSAEVVGRAMSAAFAAAAVSAAYMVKSSIDNMDAMYKLAQQTGTTVESFSALAYAAELSGVNQDGLGSALVKLTKNMSDTAAGTGDAIKGFDALGISVKNSDGSLKSSDTVLSEIAAKFAGFKDGAEKTALAVNLFGKSGAQLIPLLNGGAIGLDEMRTEAAKLGVVLDTNTSKAAELFNDNLTRMKAAVTGLSNEMAGFLLPTLNKLYSDISSFGSMAKLSGLAGEVLALDKSLKALEARKAFPLRFPGMTGDIDAEIAKTKASLDKAKAVFNAADINRPKGADYDDSSARVPALGAAPSIEEDKKKPKGKDPDADFKAYLENLNKQIQKTEDLTTAEKLLDDIRRGSLSVSAGQQKQLAARAATIDKEKEMVELRKLSRDAAAAEGDAVIKSNEAYQSRLKTLTDGGPAAQLEKQRKEMMFLADAMEQGLINAEQFSDAATGFLNLNKEIEKGKSLGEELGLTFTSAFEDAVSGGKNFSGILKGVGQDLLRLGTRKYLTEPFLEAFKGGGSGGGGFGSLFSAAAGLFTGGWSSAGLQASGAVTSGVAGGSVIGTALGALDGVREKGGPVWSGGSFLVGEKGPEIFTPSAGGAIIPNNKLGGGGITITSNPVIHIDSRSDQAQVHALVAKAVRAGNAQLVNDLQVAGAL